MKLKEYMKKKKRSAASIAKEANILPRTVLHLLEGRDVRGSTLKKISIATDGEVQMHEMVDDKHMKEKSD